MLHRLLRSLRRLSPVDALARWLGRSVEHRVAVVGGALAAIFVLSVAAAAFGGTRASLLALTLAHHRDEATLVGGQIADRLRLFEVEIRRLSRSPLFHEALTETSAGAEHLRRLVREDESPFAVWQGLRLADPSGRVVAPSFGPDAPSYAGRPWWLPLVEYAVPHADVSVEGTPALVLAYPVATATGKTEGALVLELPLQDLLADIAAGLGPPHTVALSQRGRVLATAGAPPPDGGAPTLRSMVPISQAPIPGLELSIELPRSYALGQIDALARLYALVAAVALVLAALLSRWSARLLMARFRALSAAAERVTLDGTEAARFAADGEDEPAQLARSLQRMLDRLGAARESLETRVAERTAALEFTERRLRTILDHMLDGVVIADEEGRIESFNQSAERIFGWTTEEVEGRDLACLMGAPHRGAHARHLQRYHSTGERKLIGTAREVQGTRKDGTTVPIELLVAECQYHGRRLYIAQVRDVSERYKVDRMKNEFVSVVSHELRTPLTSIRGALGLLAGGAAGPLPAEAEGLTRIALENGVRLGRLIDDLLDVQRIESGRFTFEVAQARLGELVHDAVELNQAFARRLGVEIVLVAEAPDLQISVDSSRFQQVMSNLLSNAAKFSPAGARVELWAARTDYGCVRIEVRDRGPGIPADFRSQVFEKFSQADASSERAREGTGLGLAIAKSFVERMGGAIGFTTEEGRGTTFFLEFPIADPAQRPAA